MANRQVLWISNTIQLRKKVHIPPVSPGNAIQRFSCTYLVVPTIAVIVR